MSEQTFSEKYDLREQEERFKESQRKAQVKVARWEAVSTVGIALAVSAAVIAALYFWYSYASGPETPDPSEQRINNLTEACTEKGGIILDQYNSGGSKTTPICVFSEKGAAQVTP